MKPKKSNTEISSLEAHIGFWLRLVSNHVSYAFARKLDASGVTVAEWVVLREMYGYEAAMTSPSTVATLTGLTRGAVSKLIDRLLNKQLVTRTESNDDRRFQNIQLTKEAIRLVPKLTALADENDEAFFSMLSSAEQNTLKKILKKTAHFHQLKKIPIT
ncbi:MAG: MarR family winged helix-turn-helix transcriptional regulator [Candidatus Berkiella sp.]